MRPLCMTRRSLLAAAGVAASTLHLACSSSDTSKIESSKFSMPGPFRGRVVAVEHPGSIIEGAYQAEPVKQMIEKGMRALTGSDGGLDAWRMFFQPGDVVGIKLNPVGRPHVISSPEVVREIIAKLREAGIPLRSTLQSGNELEWLRTLARPDLFLNEAWVLDFDDGKGATAARKQHYKTIALIPRDKGAPAVVLFRRPDSPNT